MHYPKLLATTGLLVGLFVACGSSMNGSDPVAPAGNNYVKVTFDGQTKTYTNVDINQAGTTLGSVSAGSKANGYVDLSFYGAAAGTYPYKQKISEYSGVSQVEYTIANTVFTNYKARVCPTTSGYYSTQGAIKLTEYVPGQVAKGTFSGELLNQNDPDECSTKGVPFSGEFSITK